MRVENGDSKCCLCISARHLHMSLSVRDQSVRLSFAARSGGGRNPYHRQHRFQSLAEPPVIPNNSAVGQQEVDTLGAVERTPAAKTDDGIYLERSGKITPGFDHQ